MSLEHGTPPNRSCRVRCKRVSRHGPNPRYTPAAHSGRTDFAVPRAGKIQGFTLIELLVVMAIIGVLLSIAAPRYFNHIEHARDNALRQSLAVMRDAIDKFHADTDTYPATLEDLVTRKYLRSIPEDPHTASRETWTVEAPADGSGVYDVHSSATGTTSEGAPLAEL